MGGSPNTTLALYWRAFFVLGVVTLAPQAIAAAAGAGQPPPLAQVGKPDREETARILDQFRQSGWFGYIEFVLRAMPRRGDEMVYRGRLWGGRNDEGAITRIEVTDAQGGVHRFLLQNGDHAAIWRHEGGKIEKVEGAAVFAPLIPGVQLDAFDLQMPFLYWPNPVVESVARVRGRPAYAFLFRPPVTSTPLPIVSIRAYFDAQFGAPIQIEQADSRRVLKTMSLVDLKKVGDKTIPKSFDLRDEVTRDKTRFEVTAVALNIEFASAVFAPAALQENMAPPSPDRVQRIDQ